VRFCNVAMNELEKIWGAGNDLSPLQMAVRALVMFVIALVMIRLGGMRIFGKKSALDFIIVIMLGAIMARGITGASPFASVVVASAVMVAVNRVLAWACGKSEKLNNIIKGRELLLYHNGEKLWDNMRKSSLTKSDLMESLRLETKRKNFDGVDKVFLENNGRISFILKDGSQ
jgi:uncharacterized membrane protein YcaP (DUF421 family)